MSKDEKLFIELLSRLKCCECCPIFDHEISDRVYHRLTFVVTPELSKKIFKRINKKSK